MYTEQQLIGFKVRHKDYVIGDSKGVYKIGYSVDGKILGVWYISGDNPTLYFVDYSVDSINRNIESGTWIPIESEIITNYSIF